MEYTPNIERPDLAAEINEKSNMPLIIGTIGIAVLIVAGGVWFWKSKKSVETIACTEEAKICPDGSSVGRTGPNCEFQECPKVQISKLDQELLKLNIDKNKQKQELAVTLPKVFTSAEWKLKEESCKKGGYDIKPYAGQEIIMRLFETSESYKGKPLDAWVMINNDEVICAYKVTRDVGSSAPAIFPLSSK